MIYQDAQGKLRSSGRPGQDTQNRGLKRSVGGAARGLFVYEVRQQAHCRAICLVSRHTKQTKGQVGWDVI